jgi:hypothetical protein
MSSFLRSHQPIAWAWVPLTAVLLSGALYDGSAAGWTRAGGAVLLAALLHRMYVGNEYVKRGDPALAWLFVVIWLLATPIDPALTGGPLDWAAAACALVAGNILLKMYRQARISHLTFRAGAAAGIAIALDPFYGFFWAALALTLGLNRPFQLREWLLLLFGSIWTGGLGWGVIAALRVEAKGWRQIREAASLSIEVEKAWAAWGIAAAAIPLLGWAAMTGTMKRVSFRSQTARSQTTILFLAAAVLFALGGWATFAGQLGPGGAGIFWRPQLPLFFSCMAAFSWVWWMPGGDGAPLLTGRKKRWAFRLRWGVLLLGLGLAAWAQRASRASTPSGTTARETGTSIAPDEGDSSRAFPNLVP